MLVCLAPSSLAQKREVDEATAAARTAYETARAKVSDASSALSRAEVARMRLERSVEVEYLQRADLLELKQYAASATRHHNRLRNDVINELKADVDYQALKERERAAAAALADAKAKPDLAIADEMPLAQALLAARKAVSEFEAAALALDPDIEDARREMNRAHEAAGKLDLIYRRLAVDDERIKQARDEVKHARERLRTARAALNDAAERLADAERREAKRRSGRGQAPVRREEQ